MYKVLVTGSRNWQNRKLIRDAFLLEYRVAISNGNKVLLIEGGAKGADRLARSVADELGISTVTMTAEWDKYGKNAGKIRNRKMLDEYEPDVVLAFPRPESKGTIHCINEAIKREIPVQIYYENTNKLVATAPDALRADLTA